MLVIWLQGIWLPLHGYNFSNTPLLAGIAMLPLLAGFLVAGPVSGLLSDRYGPRRFAVTGPLLTAVSLALLSMLPVNFSYVGSGCCCSRSASATACSRRRIERRS